MRSSLHRLAGLGPLAPVEAALISCVRPMAKADTRLRTAVAQHLELVWRVLRRAGLAPADAEDAAQDVFWILAQRAGDVPERAVRSFLVATALRVASDRRLSRWHRSVTVLAHPDLGADHHPLPDQALDDARAKALLDEALDALPNEERAVFVLAELEQMSRAEVAQALRLPDGTVASRLRRARQALEFTLRKLSARSRRRP